MGERMNAKEAYERALEDAYEGYEDKTDDVFKELVGDVEQAIRDKTYDGIFSFNRHRFTLECFTNEDEVSILRVVEGAENYFRDNGYRIRIHKYKITEQRRRYCDKDVIELIISVDWSQPQALTNRGPEARSPRAPSAKRPPE
jgi:hypothetical protein